MDYPVRWFRSGMTGAPSIAENSVKSLRDLLKLCLIEGFNPVQANTITYDGGTGRATATFSTPHGNVRHQIVDVLGADQAAFNNSFRIVDHTEYSLSWEMDDPGVTDATTASLMIVRVAPLKGWSIHAEDDANGNIAFVRDNPKATKYILSVRNGVGYGAYTGECAKAEVSMCPVDDWVDFTEQNEQLYTFWPSGYDGASSGQDWSLIGDDRMFYFCNRHGSGNYHSVVVFGDIESLVPGDEHHCIISGIQDGGSARWNYSNHYFHTHLPRHLNFDYQYMARPHHQNGGYTQWATIGSGTYNAHQVNYPDPVHKGVLVAPDPLLVKETAGGVRGWLPGIPNMLSAPGTGLHRWVTDDNPAPDFGALYWLSSSRTRRNADTEGILPFRLDYWRPDQKEGAS